jgi:aspartate/tyrosine/aromatic aminotransferase
MRAPVTGCACSLLSSRSIVVMQSCSNNPTGVDPDIAQWEVLFNIVRERSLLPVLDCAYQGFASGDLDADAASVRLCERMGIDFIVCQSFAKNMGMYGKCSLRRSGWPLLGARDTCQCFSVHVPTRFCHCSCCIHVELRVLHASSAAPLRYV